MVLFLGLGFPNHLILDVIDQAGLNPTLFGHYQLALNLNMETPIIRMGLLDILRSTYIVN